MYSRRNNEIEFALKNVRFEEKPHESISRLMSALVTSRQSLQTSRLNRTEIIPQRNILSKTTETDVLKSLYEILTTIFLDQTESSSQEPELRLLPSWLGKLDVDLEQIYELQSNTSASTHRLRKGY